MKPVQLAAMVLVTASALAAQGTSSKSRRAWVSAGLGYGASPRGTVAYLASAWYSTGAFAVGTRTGGAGGLFGEKRADRALLIGATTGDSNDFVLGGIGVGRVASSRSTADSRHAFPTATAVVYTIEAHPKAVLGLGATMFGALGSPQTRYTAFAITLNPGWFGE